MDFKKKYLKYKKKYLQLKGGNSEYAPHEPDGYAPHGPSIKDARMNRAERLRTAAEPLSKVPRNYESKDNHQQIETAQQVDLKMLYEEELKKKFEQIKEKTKQVENLRKTFQKYIRNEDNDSEKSLFFKTLDDYMGANFTMDVEEVIKQDINKLGDKMKDIWDSGDKRAREEIEGVDTEDNERIKRGKWGDNDIEYLINMLHHLVAICKQLGLNVSPHLNKLQLIALDSNMFNNLENNLGVLVFELIFLHKIFNETESIFTTSYILIEEGHKDIDSHKRLLANHTEFVKSVEEKFKKVMMLNLNSLDTMLKEGSFDTDDLLSQIYKNRNSLKDEIDKDVENHFEQENTRIQQGVSPGNQRQYNVFALVMSEVKKLLDTMLPMEIEV